MGNPKSLKFEKLLEPGYIGKVKTRNRMIKSASGVGPGFADLMPKDPILPGSPMPKELELALVDINAKEAAFYEAVAKGGAGALFCAFQSWHEGDMIPRPFWADEHISDERKIVDRIHKHGCPVFLQFTNMANMIPGPKGLMAASAVNFPAKLDMNNLLPREMTLDEVHEEQNALVNAAVRAKKAGYDGVEINAGCSHLYSTFLSRFWNRRKDQYGPQSLENQARIVLEMVQQIKQLCGPDFAVSVLMNGFEINIFELGNSKDCTTIEESSALAKLFEKAGADLLHVRSASFGDHAKGFFPDLYYMTGSPDNGYGYDLDFSKFWPEFVTKYNGAAGFLDTAAKIKKAVSIPVMTVGSMDPRLLPDVMENTLREGKVDFIAMTRPLFADPELPKKLSDGKLDEIRPCTHCYTCFVGGSGYCRVNAGHYRAGGNEMPEGYDVQPAAIKKKVLVVGGGPAGMEAARVAALRGHQVTLYEESSKLGGLMPLAAIVKGPHEKILDFTNYLSNQITKLGVKVKLGQKFDLSVINELKPDVAIVATGGKYAIPNISGIDNPKVITNTSLHQMIKTGLRFFSPFTLRSLTNYYMPIGQKVVVIGGQMQGVEVAEFFIHRRRNVTIVDEGPMEDLGKGMPAIPRERLIYFLHTHGVGTLMGVKYNEITDEGLKITMDNGLKKTLTADSVVLALPLIAYTGLANSLKGKVKEVYTVGDCKEPGVIETSVADANLTARKI